MHDAIDIDKHLNFLHEVLQKRIHHFMQKENEESFSIPEIKIEVDGSPVNKFIAQHRLTMEEYLILMLALVPHVQASFYDSIIHEYFPGGTEFPEFGGVKGSNHRSTLPTGETAQFLLAGNDIEKRIQTSRYFSPDHFFVEENILQLETVKEGEPRMSGRLILQQEYIDLLTVGTMTRPAFGPEFPAKLVTTRMEWNDLVLNPKTSEPIGDIKTWLHHNEHLVRNWEMEKRIKPGYRALFHGPSGTGKTLTATLLGKHFNKDVYRIDLSQVVSKYIGETEKNLEKVFSRAEHKDWILFFDEADALFGKRSNVQNAHDKYANQEVSYLLQRVEDFPGLIILASNFKTNLDAAFIRRFNAIIHFPMPGQEERLKIWKAFIPVKATIADDVDLVAISRRYELSGSAIVSVIHYASLQTISKGSAIIYNTDIMEGIKREYEKEEKVFH